MPTYFPDNPVVITYENEDGNANAENFYRSLRVNGWQYIRVGAGEVWEGVINKIIAYRKALDLFDDRQIVVFSDARDVFCLRPPKAFLGGFESFDGDIVLSAEIFCEGKHIVEDDYKGWQCVSLSKYFKYHNMTPKIRKFVNSGLIAGRVHALKHMYQWIIDNGFSDDQLGVGCYMNAFPEKTRLDSDAILLHTSTWGVYSGIYAIHRQKHDSPSFAELFGTGAFFLHIPGIKFVGQGLVYKLVKTHFELHTSNEFLKLCDYKVPGWDDFKELEEL